MNTKSLPAVLALIAGFATCIMSFIQHVDTVVFAKRFVVICIIFFAIGTVLSVIIQMNFKDMSDDKTDSEENENSEEEGSTDEVTDKAEETETAGEQ